MCALPNTNHCSIAVAIYWHCWKTCTLHQAECQTFFVKLHVCLEVPFRSKHMYVHVSWIIHQYTVLHVYACKVTNYFFFPLDVLHRRCTSFWWFTSTPSSISLLTSSSSPPLAAIMRSLQSSIWNTAVLEP